MIKPIVVLFYPHNELKPEGTHHQYVLQSFLRQKIGKNNPVDFKVLKTLPDELNEQLESYVNR